MSELGRKFDGKKLRWDLMPMKALESTVRVLMMGSEKYEDNNWKYVKGCRKRYYAAAQRHLTEWFEGETIDPESGETHLAHALCCIIFLAWHELNQTEEFLEDEESEEYAKVDESEISQAPPPFPHPPMPNPNDLDPNIMFEHDYDSGNAAPDAIDYIRTGQCRNPGQPPKPPGHPDHGVYLSGAEPNHDIEFNVDGHKVKLVIEDNEGNPQNGKTIFGNVAARVGEWYKDRQSNRN